MNQNHKGDNRFHPVKTSRGVRLRGLWKRNGSFYLQTTVIDAGSGLKKITKLRLEGARTADEAKAAAEKVKEGAAEGLVTTGGGPKFGDFRKHYFEVTHKAPKTLKNEKHFLEQWEKFLGADMRIGKITPQNILAYRAKVLEKGNSPRTANHHFRALKGLLQLAKVEGLISKIPTDDIKELSVENKERRLMSVEELISMGAEALRSHDITGAMFANYLTVLMYSGARMTETLLLTWKHIDWNNDQLVFTDDISKGEGRRVDMTKNLKNILRVMEANKDENSPYLFPSIRTDAPTGSFSKIMNQVRTKLNLPEFTFHLTRHFFISQCVMKGIDYLTIAKWVGHKDGGVLIGKIYGHLDRKHMKAQADKLSF